MATVFNFPTVDLLSAIQHESIPNVKLALEQGCDVKSFRGNLKPLQAAAMLSNVSIMNLLIEHGAEVNAVDGYGRTALHYAGENCIESVELLIKKHAADPTVTDANGATPLHWAAYKGKADCVRFLLENGSDVNAKNMFGETALFWAVRKTGLEVVKILLDYNVDSGIVNDHGEVAVHKTWFLYAMHFDCDDDMKILDLLSQTLDRLPWYPSKRDTLRDALTRTEQCKHSKLQEILQQGNIISLKRICRYKIRQYMGPVYLPDTVCKLPIPPGLKDYVLMVDSLLQRCELS